MFAGRGRGQPVALAWTRKCRGGNVPMSTISAESPAAAPDRTDPVTAMRAPVRVGVVGCGYWGPNIIRNFSALDDCQVRVVCDRDPTRLEAIRRRDPAVRCITEFADLIADPQLDAVAICTPVQTHYELAQAALDAGKHVMVEKPLTDSVESSAALTKTAAARQLTLMVDHTFVFSGPVQMIKSMVDRHEIGEVLYFDSVRINLGLFQSDINVVWDLAPHDLSIMDYLIDRTPVWISAVGSTHFGQLENMAYQPVE